MIIKLKCNLEKVMIPVALLLTILAYATPNNVENLSFSEDEKTVIVTGGNRGMGLGWVKHYLGAGHTVIATARKPEKATDLLDLQKKYDGKLLIQKLDVTSEEHMDALSEMLQKNNIKIDIAISNAGVTILEDFGDWTADGFGYNYKVNTLGPALFAQAIAPHLSNGATIVQITSGGGSITYSKRNSNLDGYRVSKAGLNMLTKLLSHIFEDREIIVISLSPGGVKTDMNLTAERTVEEAVAQMAGVVAKLTMENSGTFINFRGKVMAW